MIFGLGDVGTRSAQLWNDMMTDAIASSDTSCTFPPLGAGSLRSDLPVEQGTNRVVQPADRDHPRGFSGGDAAAVRIAKRSTSDHCHDIAMLAAVITVIAILLPHVLRFAHVRF